MDQSNPIKVCDVFPDLKTTMKWLAGWQYTWTWVSFLIGQQKYPPSKTVEEHFFMLCLDKQQSDSNQLAMSLCPLWAVDPSGFAYILLPNEPHMYPMLAAHVCCAL